MKKIFFKDILRPSNLYFISLSICTFLFFFGPYQYISTNSLFPRFYLYLVFFIFGIGIRIGESSKYTKKNQSNLYFISKLGEFILITFNIIFFLSSISYFLITIVNLTSGFTDFTILIGSGLADTRMKMEIDFLQGNQRSLLEKIFNALSGTSISITLIYLSIKKVRMEIFFVLSIFSPIFYGLTELIRGGRNPSAFVILCLIIAFKFRSRIGNSFSGLLKSIVKIFYFISTFFIVIFLLIFGWRKQVQSIFELDSSTQLMFNTDVNIRPFYETINQFMGNLLSIPFELSFYITHGIAFFSSLFERTIYNTYFLGTFSFPGILILTNQSELVMERILDQELNELYPTMVHGLLMDFGIFFTPIIAFLIGFIIGNVFLNAIHGNFQSICFSPVLACMAIISPIFTLNYGGLDQVIIMLSIELIFFGLISIITKKRIFYKV